MTASNESNRSVALALAAKGIAVFPSLRKKPVPSIWQKLDDTITAEDRAAAAERAKRKNKPAPKLFGCTLKAHKIKTMWRDMPSAVTSISCGPSGLIVVDADRNEKGDGSTLTRDFFALHSVDLTNVPCTTTKSLGTHFIFSNPDGVGCGKLRALNVDIKGVGGQVVAPGSVYVDDEGNVGRYVAQADHPALAAAFAAGTIPPVPQCIVDLMEAAREPSTDNEPAIQAAAEQLNSLDDVDTAALEQMVEALKLKDDEFRQVWDEPTGDHSEDRFTVAKCMLREYGPVAFTPAHLGALYAIYDGAGSWIESGAGKGEYDDRAIAREWVRAQRASGKIVDTSLLGDVSGQTGSSLADRVSTDPYDRLPDVKPANTPVKRTLPFETDEDLDDGPDEPPVYLVDEIIERGILFTIYGNSNDGKSSIVLDMLLRIAYGLPWAGRPTKRVGVLYLTAEGPLGSKRRIRAWRHKAKEDGTELKDSVFEVLRVQVDLFSDDKDLTLIAERIRTFEQRRGIACGIVVVDTMRQAMIGGDENSTRDVGVFIAKLTALRDRYGVAAGFVHHLGKDATRGAAGTAAIVSNVDVALRVEGEANVKPSRGTIKGDKLRDGFLGEPIRYRLTSVDVGKREDGRAVTAPLAVVGGVAAADPLSIDVSEEEAIMDQGKFLAADDVLGLEGSAEAPGSPEDGGKGHVKPDRLLTEGAAQNERREALIDLLLSGTVERIPYGKHMGHWRAESVAPHSEEIRRLFDAGNFTRDFRARYLRGEPTTGTKRGRIGVERGGKLGTIITFQAQGNGKK